VGEPTLYVDSERVDRGCGSPTSISSSGTGISNRPNRRAKCMCELFHLSIEAGEMIPCKAKQKSIL